MREENGSQRQGVGIDNNGEVEHGYGVERNSGGAGDRAQQWHIEGRRHGDGPSHNSIGARQSSRGWTGSGVGAKGCGNREVGAEEG